jgi:hypothetical protein
MPIIEDIPLGDLEIFPDYKTARPGELLFLGQDVKAVGMRAVSIVDGHSNSGFVPFEGPNQVSFISDDNLGSVPAVGAKNKVNLIVVNIEVERVKRGVSVGDVCRLQGSTDLCLAIARPVHIEFVGAFLMLEGEHTGRIVTDYQPEIRLGKIGLSRNTERYSVPR